MLGLMVDLVCWLCREQLDASYDKLKALRQQEAALLAELQQQQAAGSSSEAELAGMQALVDDLARKKVRQLYRYLTGWCTKGLCQQLGFLSCLRQTLVLVAGWNRFRMC